MTTTFNFTRQFALLSFTCILLSGLGAGFLLSEFLTQKLLTREAELTQEFIRNFVDAEGAWLDLVSAPGNQARASLDSFAEHVVRLPAVVRANIYGADRSVLWSSDPLLIGKRFQDNHELEEALRGELTFESGIVGATAKSEHRDFDADQVGLRFVETYVPIWKGDQSTVLGAIELYKLPRALHQAILEGQRLIWLSALGTGVLLFAALFQIVRRASRTMEEQQRRLVESERLSMVGETASAVAHAMRNPLASIRACAELTLTDDLEGARESAADIISEADRLNRWARELLEFSRADGGETEVLDITQLVAGVLESHASDLSRARVTLRFDKAHEILKARASPAPLAQVFGNLVMNAIEAMEQGGTLRVVTALEKPGAAWVIVSISDTGPGLSSAMEGRLFRPFATTKPTGTGLGLALSQRLVQRYQGSLTLDSRPGQGVTAIVRL
ncbi:MAG: ATP-binding protein, partial [Chromatiaceae bacterium]